ncbi:MAG: AI-2E family transporter [Myxococcota bacterium]|nr:AI-2E family transporter [Myxococcota bacterium]
MPAPSQRPGDDGAGAGRPAAWESLRRLVARDFADPQVFVLALLLGGGLLLVLLLGEMLAPLIAALVIAYVLQGPVAALTSRGAPHWAAVTVVFLGFLGFIVFGLLALVPLLSQQLTQLVRQFPTMVTTAQEIVLTLPERYPELIGREQVVQIAERVQEQALALGQAAVTYTVNRIGNLFELGVFLFIVPLVVFFFLKDRDMIVAWFLGLLPRQRNLAAQVWSEVDQKIGAYVRGKIYEIGILGAATYVTFTALGMPFAALLSVITGLSVLVPYIGVVAAAVPVVFVALVHFGLGGDFAMAVGAYAILQVVDGNLLAPLLISEVVDLHPIAVIGAILFFGGIWGFWGVFFAIPLATLAVAVVKAWPRRPAGAFETPAPAETLASTETPGPAEEATRASRALGD